MMHQTLLFLHIISVTIWVGGMFFAYFCLRPAAGQVLEPSNRLPLWMATFNRFLRFSAIAVIIIIATGFTMLLQVGFKFAPIGWHVMLSVGLLMALIFVYVYAFLYPKFCSQCEAAAWPAAAATLNSTRKMVGLNLVLSVIAIAAAAFAR